jgi:hypothetical protein
VPINRKGARNVIQDLSDTLTNALEFMAANARLYLVVNVYSWEMGWELLSFGHTALMGRNSDGWKQSLNFSLNRCNVFNPSGLKELRLHGTTQTLTLLAIALAL